VETHTVECLNCGATRELPVGPSRPAGYDECRRCGYLGWAEHESLSEALRRVLRERPLPRRRLHVAG
jgi:hypothetical protein